MKKIIAMAAVLVGLSLSSAAQAASGVVTVLVPDWTGGVVSCQILANAIERELGYKVKRLEIPSGPASLEAMVAGDADVGCELWPTYYPNKEKLVTDFGGKGVELAGEHGVVGKSGYYVPRYLVEGSGAKAPNLKNFKDLAQYASVFKSVDTGDKGRLIGCPLANWACDDQARLDALGIPFVSVELGSETAQYAEMQGAYQRKEAFVAYAYEPHWIHVALDLVPLELAADPTGDGACRPECGWAKEITFNYLRQGLASEHPEVAALVKKSTLSNQEQNSMTLAIDVDGRDLEEVVDEWMDKNASTIKGWAN